MFKKLFLALLGIVLATSIAFAAPIEITIIDAVTLDDDPTSVTSSTYRIGDYKKVAFFVNYNETEVGNSVSGAVSLDISYDASNWIDASFHDYAGGATLQTSETISADGWFFAWLDIDTIAPYVRMVVAGTNTDTDDIIVVSAYLVGIK